MIVGVCENLKMYIYSVNLQGKVSHWYRGLTLVLLVKLTTQIEIDGALKRLTLVEA